MRIAQMIATGGANYDMSTGLVYGFHYPNCVPDIHEKMMNDGEDISYRDYKQSVIDSLISAIEPVFEEHAVSSESIDDAAEHIFDDYINEGIELESDHWHLEDEEGGLELELTESNLIVLKSPVITWVAQCSPCVPNGGDLESPRKKDQDGVWSYCLPESFFSEDGFDGYPYIVTMKTEDYIANHRGSEDEQLLGMVEKVLDHNSSKDEVYALKKVLMEKGFINKGIA